ncbi:transketolase [Anaerotalea alkaliphila]|uniref:Transketolase n=1 Tax=Anaerotalea alkaliphila TaxID=2662126 RepID=A0A7X5HVB3_9FIRM|nr:transketolase [Anaerotalea alkaliphila]NDL67166.1 transketolase [Anaerotalea alkaliphila]
MAERVELVRNLETVAKRIRRNIIESVGVGVAGHIGGSFSSADMVAALYFHKMRYSPTDLGRPDRDRFILSKGHVAILQYAALVEAGIVDRKELKKTKTIGSCLQGHPDVMKTPGIEAGTGSLGQGLSIGLGMALAQRLDGQDAKTYVLMGDGELAEGQIWEAAMAAANFKVSNLVGIVDRNRLQATGRITERFNTNPLNAKWKAFGWEVIEVEDGNDMPQLLEALEKADKAETGPTVIIMDTVKGKGLSFAENVVGFHNGMLTQEQYDLAMAELA